MNKKNMMAWWLGECRLVRPLMQKNEMGEKEKVTRLEIVMIICWVVVLVLLCGISR